MKRQEGFAEVTGGKIWYEVVGKKGKTPLITLHGGPGYPHDYLQPLEDLSSEREVVFYDQLGCGNSDRPSNTSLWTVERFTKELSQFIDHLNLSEYHILGHSWGSALAVSFALKKPKGLRSLILSDPYISTPRWEKDAKRLLKLISKKSQKVLKKYEKGGDREDKEYKDAVKEFHDRFIRNVYPLPRVIIEGRKKKSDEVYNHMWGPEEFWVSGTLKNFDPTKKLKEIKVPTLLVCGRFDEATPQSSEFFSKKFPKGEFKVLEKSEHNPFWNERKKYMDIVNEFLKRVEK